VGPPILSKGWQCDCGRIGAWRQFDDEGDVISVQRVSASARWNGINVLGVANNVNTALNVRGHGRTTGADLKLYDGTATTLATWPVGFDEGDRLDGSIEIDHKHHHLQSRHPPQHTRRSRRLHTHRHQDHRPRHRHMVRPLRHERIAAGDSIWHMLKAITA
jgi:hypothetical protein